MGVLATGRTEGQQLYALRTMEDAELLPELQSLVLDVVGAVLRMIVNLTQLLDKRITFEVRHNG